MNILSLYFKICYLLVCFKCKTIFVDSDEIRFSLLLSSRKFYIFVGYKLLDCIFMRKLLFALSLIVFPLFVFGQNISQKDSAKLAWKELMRKCEIEDSLLEVERMKPVYEAFNKEKRKYLGKTYYLKKGSKLYRKGSPFKCVALNIDKNLNATISLVNRGDTLTMSMDFSEISYRLSLTDEFKALFSFGSSSSAPKEKINYRLVAKTLYIGMSKKSVLYLMGKPNNIRTTITDNINYEFWEYPNNVYLNFLNDKLKVIQIY